MDYLVRLTAFGVACMGVAIALPAVADYEGPSGYGTATQELDVSHDGYAREEETSEKPDATTYVVIEAADGKTEEVDGETVIVVQEPEPIAATEEAPPAPKTPPVEQPAARCPGAIWVDGYWYYSNGEYLWVDGHCVVERVNYVFVHPRWDYYANVWWFVPGYYRPWGVWVGFGYWRPWHWYPPYFHPYYPTHRPVPVHRSVPRRPTTVQPTPASRTPTRGVVRRPGYVENPTSTVGRGGARPTRTSTVARPQRTGTRLDTVDRSRMRPAQTTVVGRPPSSTTRTGTVGRAGNGPTLTRTVPRTRTGSPIVTQPRVPPRGTGSIYRSPSPSSRAPSVSRPSTAPSRTGPAPRPRGGGFRTGGASSRPSSAPSRSPGSGRPSYGRPSSGGGFRGGGFGRPSSGSFGGGRSVSPARGR